MKKYIAIDIGGTKIKYGVVTSSGKIMKKDEIFTPVLNNIVELKATLFSIVDVVLTDEIQGIGIATLGGVDEKQGIVRGICDNFIFLKDFPLKTTLEEIYHLPVHIMNDVNAAALGEASFGSGIGLNQFFCITLGTGIGGALVIDGKVYQGQNGFAGEVGLIRGCNDLSYEELASARAFSNKAQKIKKSNGKVLSQALKEKGPYDDLLDEWITNVAQGLIDIIYTIDPGTIVIGGGISEIGSLLTNRIQEKVDHLINEGFVGKTNIVAAKYGNSSNLIGAIIPLTKFKKY